VIESAVAVPSARAQSSGQFIISIQVAPDVDAISGGCDPHRPTDRTNLVSNAAAKFTDYTDHQSRCVTTDTPDAARYRVTPIGLTPTARNFRELSHLRKRMGRPRASTAGSGLDRAIPSRPAEPTGYEIGVESTDGQGSTFWFATMGRLERSCDRASHFFGVCRTRRMDVCNQAR